MTRKEAKARSKTVYEWDAYLEDREAWNESCRKDDMEYLFQVYTEDTVGRNEYEEIMMGGYDYE